jgi:lipopolysaccharide heptosyltransferase I
MFARKRPPLVHLNPRCIALIKPSALGDIVHALPVLEALRYRFPNAHIAWVVNRSYEPLLIGHPCLDETIPFDRQALGSGIGKAVRAAGRFAGELRRRRFDLAIDMQGLFRSGLMTLATGAKRRVGFSIAREGARYCYTDRIPTLPLDHEHAVDRNWRMAQAFGVGRRPKRFIVPIADDARRWAVQGLRDCPRPWLVFAVGARWLTKRWPAEHFALLARRAQAHFGGTALFVGARDESELARGVVGTLAGPVRDWVGKTTLPQLAALLERADVMIANDTGPLHLAAALDRPVIAPYTCTQVRLHGPYGVARGAVESAIWCQGSYLRQCDRLECMTELHPDRLWFFLHETLAAWASRYRSA